MQFQSMALMASGHALGAHNDQGAHHGRHMHGDVVRAGGDDHQNAQQSDHRDDGLLLVQRLPVSLSELRHIAGVGDELPAHKGEVQGAQHTHTDAEGGDAHLLHDAVGSGVGAHAHQGDEAAELSAEEQGQQSLGGTDAGGQTHGGDQGGHGGHDADVAAHGADGAGDDQSGQNDVPLALAGDFNHLLTDHIGDAGVEQRGTNYHHTGQQDDSVAVVAGEDVAYLDDAGVGFPPGHWALNL